MARLGRRVVLVHFIALSAAAASAQSYWAVDDGAVLTYSVGSITVGREGDYSRQGIACRSGEIYQLAEDGDVLWSDVYLTCGQLGETSSYQPVLLLLDLPLTTGKTWSATSTWHGADRRVYLVTLDGEVRGPTTAPIPGIGDEAPVIAVHLSLTYASIDGSPVPPDEDKDWLLHAQLGRVDGLLAWQGVVPGGTVDWSSVKAMYR